MPKPVRFSGPLQPTPPSRRSDDFVSIFPGHNTSSEYIRGPTSWLADGQRLSFVELNPTTGYDIWVLDMKDRKAVPFLRTPFNEVGWFSPDGRWMAYMSNESGRSEVYVQPYPGPGGKWQISTDGGMDPRWSANGRELTYRNGDKVMEGD